MCTVLHPNSRRIAFCIAHSVRIADGALRFLGMTLTSAAFHAIMFIFQVVRSSLVLRSKPMIGATIPTYFVSPRRSIMKA